MRRPTTPVALSGRSPPTACATAAPPQSSVSCSATAQWPGKTGSSEYHTTETFVGFTPQIAAAGIAADPNSPDDAVPPRIQALLDGILVAAAGGDEGMAHLMTLGEPERSRTSLADLLARIPAVDRLLA